MRAARKGFSNICKVLILHATKRKSQNQLLSIQNTAGETVFHLVAKYGRLNVFQVLISAINGTDGFPVKGKLSVKEKKMLLNMATNIEERTAFQYASWFSQQDIAVSLANNGAKVRLADSSGRTALHLASEKRKR